MALVLLGNTGAGQVLGGDWYALPGERITRVEIPDSLSTADAVRSIIHADGLWRAHSTNPHPDWVESDDAALATAISNATGCPIGRPQNWSETA